MRFMVSAVLLTLCQVAPALAASDDQKYGQYLCRVEHAAGLRHHKGEALYAGAINLPESELTFGVTISPITRSEIDVTLCKRSFEHYLPMIEHGVPFKSWDAPKGLNDMTHERHGIGSQCLTKDEAVLSSAGDGMQWSYRGYDSPFEFYGVIPGDWFSLYDNETFERSFPYDSGPVITAGHCVKMPRAK